MGFKEADVARQQECWNKLDNEEKVKALQQEYQFEYTIELV